MGRPAYPWVAKVMLLRPITSSVVTRRPNASCDRIVLLAHPREQKALDVTPASLHRVERVVRHVYKGQAISTITAPHLNHNPNLIQFSTCKDKSSLNTTALLDCIRQPFFARRLS